MADFVFTSPGVKFREKNLTYVSKNVGVTTLGLVGETLKGPAFEPIFIEDMGKFRRRLGGLSYEKYSNGTLRYQLPYVANSYLSESSQLWVTRVLGLSGYDAGKAWAITLSTTGSTQTFKENMVLAVIRSKGRTDYNVDAPKSTFFYTDTIEITENNTTGSTGDFFNTMKITITPNDDPNTDDKDESSITKTIEFSLNPAARNFLPNVLSNNSYVYIESIYPELLKAIDADDKGYSVNSTLLDINSNEFADYNQQYQTPKTPWVVSQLKGSELERLFRFISISDGSSANKEIKISIQNINPITNEFDVIVRDFYDTDDNVIVLESFSRCTMRKELNNYVASRIGTIDGEYSLKSEYIILEMNEEASEDSFPCGFEGYEFPDFHSDNTNTTSGIDGITPTLLYKQSYLETDNLNRTYLGISERAYGTSSRKLDQNFFNYFGVTVKTKTKGFHLDSGVSGNVYDELGEFENGVAQLRTVSDITDENNPYSNVRARKFTFVPYGGFDGWDIHSNERTHGDNYRKGGVFDGVELGETPYNDFQAWEKAIQTFANPEDVTINIFATPGINWGDNNILVKNTLNMIERERTDSLYIIDAPDIDPNDYPVGENERLDTAISKEIVNLLDVANIDSNYAATYYPYIQLRDNDNNVNIWLPPTGEVVKSMAYTDNTKFPWFAPAGLQRGVTSAIRTRFKLSLDARDILYAGRINPLAEFANTGTAIFGQKTLQVAENALDRINVRRLLLELKVLISNISTRLLFEQNDDTTIDQFIDKTKPILQRVQRERGLYDFRIVMDDSNNTPESRDRNELYGEIYIKPTASLEFIGIGFTLTPSGASFDEVMS
jgi:hypothetical protein